MRYWFMLYGISVVMGKIGLIIGSSVIVFLRIRGVMFGNFNFWMDYVLEIYVLFMLFGLGIMVMIVEIKRKMLEELVGEYDMFDEEIVFSIDNKVEGEVLVVRGVNGGGESDD